MLSSAEENYLKAIYKLSEKSEGTVNTNSIAESLQTKAASVTDMLKRLAEKDLLHYEKYKGVNLTTEGTNTARYLIRKHRLWEVFLVEKLDFNWDEVHEIAEQLEHIRSKTLIEKLDEFLNFPKYDPHGDPIPDKNGKFAYRPQQLLAEIREGKEGVIVGVKDSSQQFLQYLDKIKLTLGTPIKVTGHFEYDGSKEVILEDGKSMQLSERVAKNLYIQEKES